jgi:DNA-directed RNA polymerase omega subunit
MDLLNDDRDLDSQITSRYTIVIAAAKRARQIVSGASYDPDPEHRNDKAVSIAVSELGRGIIKLYPDGLPNSIMDAKRELDRQRDPRYYDRKSFRYDNKPDSEITIEIDDDETDEFEPTATYELENYDDMADGGEDVEDTAE